MLMDQKLDLTLAVTMLPVLVELHHIGICFKCNTYDLLYFMSNSSLSLFTSFRFLAAIIVSLKWYCFSLFFFTFIPFFYTIVLCTFKRPSLAFIVRLSAAFLSRLLPFNICRFVPCYRFYFYFTSELQPFTSGDLWCNVWLYVALWVK